MAERQCASLEFSEQEFRKLVPLTGSMGSNPIPGVSLEKLLQYIGGSIKMGDYGDDFTKEFFKRTLENLEVYDKLHNSDRVQYPNNVTHLINSLLGLLVFVKEEDNIMNIGFHDYTKIEWNYNGEQEDFRNLLKHLRNSIAHKRITPEVDSQNDIIALSFKDSNNHGNLFEVKITVANTLVLIKKLDKNYGLNYKTPTQ